MIEGKLSVAVGGQSLAAIFLKQGRHSFALRLKRRLPEAPAVRVWGFAMAGSVAASTNRPTDPEARAKKQFWWDMDRDQPSSDFTAGLSGCAPFLGSPCDCLIWDQGQSDALAVDSCATHGSCKAIEDYVYATTRVLDHWRAALAPGRPESVPILVLPHAPHPAELRGGGAGVQRVRAAQQDLCRTIPNCHDGSVIQDMALKDNLHPTTEGVITYGLHVAETFARLMTSRGMQMAARSSGERQLDAVR